MSRPLLEKSLAELSAQVERNHWHPAELGLVRDELRHRESRAAKALLIEVNGLISRAIANPVSSRAVLANASRRQKKASSLIASQEAIAQNWNDRPRLLVQKLLIANHQGAEAERIRRMLSDRIAALGDELDQEAHDPRPESLATENRIMTDVRRWTEEAVADLRKKLIDLGKRNPLIAFKHGSRSASHLRFVDERPDLLFGALDEGTMGFEPLPGEDETPKDELTPGFRIAYERARLTDEVFLAATENLGEDESDARALQDAERALRKEVRRQLGLPPLDYGKSVDVKALARAHGFDPSFDLKSSDDDDVAAHHEDDKIRVLLIRKELEKRLKSIWERYRSHARDTGLHTLFVVMGFVEWFEDDVSDVALHAPLLLLSVELDRRVVRGRYEYELRGRAEGLQVNVALAEKMRRHFGLELPVLRDGEIPESYFIRVAAVLEKGHRLSVRRFATLAVLPFPRMVLWTDLDPAEWPEAAFADHNLLPGLLGAKDVGTSSSMAETFDIDAHPWADKAPPLIQPADASQHSALIDVVEGHSLAIEGPPGTGKSQTITNIIASALDAGKRVLFVAEKQAALAVVASRLKMMGFGPLLLELHGDNANRADFYESLRARLALRVRSDADALGTSRQQLKRQRDLIRRYLSLIGTKLGALGRTAYWLAWREIHLRDTVDREAVDQMARRWRTRQTAGQDRATLAAHRSELDNFGMALAAIDAARVGDSRSLWARAERLGPFDQQPQLGAARDAAAVAAAMAQAVEEIDDAVPLALPPPSGPTAEVAAQLTALSGFGEVEEDIVRSALHHPEEARALLARQGRWRQLRDKLELDVSDPSAADDDAIAALLRAIERLKSLPASVAQARAKLAEALGVIAAEEQTRVSRADLMLRLGLRETIPAGDLLLVTTAIAGLAAVTPTIAALYSAALLDPLAELTLHHERQGATALQEERATIGKSARPEAFEIEVNELSQLADVLASSNFFERIFGGRFRNAKRQVAGLLHSYDGRETSAEILRQLSRHKGRVATFRAESAATQWFPPVLWRGIDSDWGAIVETSGALKETRDRLMEIHSENSLDHWLAFPSTERSRISGIAKQLSPVLGRVVELGLADSTNAALPDALASERDNLRALDSALTRVHAETEGLILRDGEHLADRLGALRATQAEFDRLAAGPGFAWISGIVCSLDELARALSHTEVLAAIPGPLNLLVGLRRCGAPGAGLNAAISKRDLYAAAERAWQLARNQFEGVTGVGIETFGESVSDWRSTVGLLSRLADDEMGARLAADLLRYRSALAEIDCAAFGTAALDGVISADEMSDVYELLVVRALLTEYLGGDGSDLARLGSLSLEAARKEYVRLDKELHELEANAIIAKRSKDVGARGVGHGPKRDWTDMALLDSELSLKKPRTPIRDLTHRAGGALQALKPVWMMSPTSAAQYIRPNSLKFDILVVDEASQMRPEFALSAIMRGDQFVVVGDANQLPPTDFFATSSDDGDDDSGDDTVKVDTESILDLANHRFQRKRRLKWHYRSQHEGLIQFSNREFYGRDLVVFPSPTTEDDVLGVKCQYVGGTYEASINQREAQEVIEEAFRLMRTYPQYSLGIVTMNAKQTELIRNEFDRLTLEAPEVRSYIEEYAGGIDEFFIKNLENVQGDERDIILISTVYGPAKDGTVAQRFGPMNWEVGWRRLNVLVTRAKRSTRLFTSLRPNDVKVTETSSRGLLAFKAYLTYAHNGAQYDETPGGEPDSDFEMFVADALRGAGYEVVHQVGVEGFRIDLGARHPDYPIGFIAGIECDGASYHTGLTVRDRDRIRQTILEGMGWKIYRIWSTDWFADPARETAKLLTRLDEWRSKFASEFKERLASDDATPTKSASVPPQLGIAPKAPDEIQQPVPTAPDVAVPHSRVEQTETVEQRQPSGRPMRPLEDIIWFEVAKGQSYEVWLADTFAGRVDVLSRATSAPQVYGGRVLVARSEYEGWVAATDAYFKNNDIHAAVREVARRAKEHMPAKP